MKEKILYKPFVSNVKNKKYSVYVKSDDNKSGIKLISFGDVRFQHFKDKIGEYSHLDHYDLTRKKNYYKRFGKTNSKNTAKYWSHKILW